MTVVSLGHQHHLGTCGLNKASILRTPGVRTHVPADEYDKTRQVLLRVCQL